MSTGCLDSLQNPLSRVNVLRDGMNLVKNPLDGTTTWGSLRQYYVNDVATSSVNGGAYVMSGGPDGLTCVRGGVDPSEDTTGVWTSFAQFGPSDFTLANSASAPAPTVAIGGAGVYTVTNASLVDLAPNSTWLVSWQGLATGPLVAVAADLATWTFGASGAGAGAIPASVTVVPAVGALSWSFSVSAVVVLGDAAVGPPVVNPTLAVTGAYGGAAQAISNVSVSWTRLA